MRRRKNYSTIRSMAILAMIFSQLLSCLPISAAWYNNDWAYRKKITIEHQYVNGNLLDFPVYVDLSDLSSDFFDDVKTDGSDIVVTSSDEVTKVSRELEHIDTVNDAGGLWFKAPSLSATANTDFYLYYGYSGASETNVTGVWNGYAVVAHLDEVPDGTAGDIDDSTDQYEGDSKDNMNGDALIDAKLYKGYDFQPETDYHYIDFGHINELDNVSAFTWSFWAKQKAEANDELYMGQGPDDPLVDYQDGLLQFTPAGLGNYAFGGQVGGTGEHWHHTALVYNGDLTGNNRFKLYQNGDEVVWDFVMNAPDATTGSDTNGFYLGYDQAQYSNLLVDEFRINTRSESAAWIKTSFDNQNNPSTFYSIASAQSGTWFNGDWTFRKKITIEKSEISNDRSNFPVMIDLNSLGEDFHANVKSDGSDIVVTSDDQITRLSRELESINTTTNQGILWFKAPLVSSSSNSDFYLYYGNPSGAEVNDDATWNGEYLFVSHFQDDPTGSSGDAIDSTPNSNNGSSAGAMAAAVTGKIANAWDFDGSNDRIDYGDLNALDGVSTYTISTWLKKDSSGISVFGKGNSGNIISISSDESDIYFYPTHESSYRASEFYNTNWNHLAVVYDGNLTGTSRFKYYLNAEEISYGATTTPNVTFAGNNESIYVAYEDYNSRYFDGSLDEFRVSTNALEYEQIQSEYSNQNTPDTFYSVGSQTQGGTDVTAPSVLHFGPLDNAVHVAITSNLDITFNENMDVTNGTILIKRSSDDVTVQTIDTDVASIAGNGTNILSVDISDLVNYTDYYVEIGSTAFADSSGNAFAGFSSNGTWNFTTVGAVDQWHNGDWLYRAKITIPHSSVNGDLVNFPVMFDLSQMTDTLFFNQVNGQGLDVLITDDEARELGRDLEYLDTSSNAGILWFKALELSSTANNDFYLYWGNSSANKTNDGSAWNGQYLIVSHFDEVPTASNSDYEFQDSTSNNNDGKSQGTMTSDDQVAGKIYKAIDLDGTDDSINYDDISAMDALTELTVSAWINVQGSNMAIVGKGQGSKALEIYEDGSDITFSPTGSGNSYTATKVSTETWHYLVGVYDASLSGTSRFKYYLDGDEGSFGGTSTPLDALATNNRSLYAGFADQASMYHNGLIDEWRIGTAAHSAAWVKTEYDNQNGNTGFFSVGLQETVNGDTIKPFKQSVSPVDGATYVAIDSNLSISFNENIDIRTGNFYIKQLSDDSTAQTLDVTSVATGNGSQTIYLDPPSDLANNTQYYVTLDNGALADLAGNDYDGFTGNGVWNFTSIPSVGDWYDSAWTYRRKITVPASSVDADFTNFTLLFNLSQMTDTYFFDQVNGQGLDIVITNDVTRKLGRDLEYMDVSSNLGLLWFKADSLSSTSNNDFYIYWGNSSANETNDGAAWNGEYLFVSHYDEEPTASTADAEFQDATANDNDGSSKGTMTSADTALGKIHKAVYLDGNDEYIDHGDINDFDGVGQYTISTWFKRTGSYTAIFGKGDSDHIVDFYSEPNPFFYFYPTDTTNSYNNDARGTKNQWHHFAAVFNGSLSGSSRFEWYLDGQPGGFQSTSTPNTTFQGNSSSIKVGYAEYNDYRHEGYMDEYHVATLARSQDWIATEYDNQNGNGDFFSLGLQETINGDTVKPFWTSFTPVDGATFVAIDSNLSISFNENIDIQTGNFNIKRLSDDVTVQAVDVAARASGNGSKTIYLDPASNLPNNVQFYVEVENGALADLAGNDYDGFSSNTTWNFTTIPSVGTWYNGDWVYREKLTVEDEKVNGDVADFPVILDLNDLSQGFWDNVNGQGLDIVVTDDVTRKLERELEHIDTTNNQGILWFKAPSLSATSNTDFYLYYGNSSAAETNSTDTWNSGYKVVTHFSEVPTVSNLDSEFQDSTSNDYDGQSTGAMDSNDQVTGKMHKAVDPDATNDYINYGNVSEMNEASKLTLSQWFKRDAIARDFGITKTNSDSSAINLYASTADIYATPHYDNDGNVQSSYTPDANWHYVVSVFNGSAPLASRFKVYLDGVMNSNGTINANLTQQIYANDLRVGSYYDSDAANEMYTDGYIDEFRVSTNAHTKEWVITEYNNQDDPTTFFSFGSQEGGIDSTDPEVTSFSPADDATGVSVSTNMSILFDDIIDIQAGNIDIYENGNGLFESIDVTTNLVTGNGSATIYIDPTNNFNGSTMYYVRIDSSAFDDDAGNSFAGITDNGTWNFTTIDDTAPLAITFSPIDNGTGVSLNTNLVITFDEAVETQSGNITIKKLSDNSTVEALAVTSPRVTGNGSTIITINPTDSFDYSTSYYVEIAADAFDNLVGLSYAGLSGNGDWNFTTLDPVVCNGILEHNGTTIDSSVDSYGVDAADLDDDGDTDFASVDYGNSRLYWYSNNGDGSYSKILVASSLASPRHVEITDLDGDGDNDLVINSQGNNYIYWYDNNGSESFNGAYIATSVDSYDFEVVDLDEDGDNDVVSTAYADGDLNWYENNGNEGFTAYTIDSNLTGAAEVRVIDMDGDGDLDVVATGYVAEEVNWYENDGSEGFTEHSIESTFSEALGLAVVDIDGDGDIDVIANSADDNGLVLFDNDGSENFTLQTIDNDLSDAYKIDTADIDGDGDIDILSGSYDDDDVILYKNDGSENFSANIIHSHFDGVRAVMFYDVDGDDVSDIIAGASGADDVRWFKTENCTDTTNPSAQLYAAYNPEDDSSGVERDTDLILEFTERVYEGSGNIVIKKSSDDTTVETISVTDSEVTGSGSSTIRVNPTGLLEGSTGYYVQIDATAFDDSIGRSYAGILDTTTWNFTTMTACNGILRHNGANLDTSIDSQSLDVGDLDGDGDEDVVSIDYANSQLYWYENDGSESFTKTLLDISLSSPRTVELSDLDEDGDLDIIITSLGSNYIYWYENDGNASFSEYYIDSGLTDAYDIEVADLDGDGDKDVIASSYAGGNIYWFENDLDQDNKQFFKQWTIEADIAGVTYVKVVDMDGDDDLDVVATGYIADEINWYENDGSQSFTERSIESTFSEALGLDVVDIDNDGDIDVVANSADDNGLVLFENDGSENFTLQTIDGDLSDAYEIDTADIDGDGDLDILSGSYDEHDLVLYKNDGSENFSKEIVHSHFMGVRTVKFHDIDGDDVLDIIAGSSTSDDIRWFKTENCTDVTNPSAHVHTDYDPEDDSSGIHRDSDLILEFNERVYEGSGNIVIKKSSDDSTVETIAVTDSKVTGSGSATITVNPSILLDASTGYYVEIAATAFDDSVNNSYAGITGSTTWNFTTMTACNGILRHNGANLDTSIDSQSLDVGDLDGDGDEDVVSIDYANSQLYWYENDGSESFTKTLLDISLSSPRTVELSDLDEDGDLDIIITSLGSNYIYWYENDGNASFSEYYIDSGLTDAYDIEVADLDGDGDKDVIATSYAGGNIYWFENDLDEDNDQYFKQKTIETDIAGVTYVKVVDMDGDDDLDVVATGYIADEINWYENDGSEGFTEHSIESTFSEALGLDVIDIDNDGDIDVVANSADDNGLVLFENDGSENFTLQTIDGDLSDAYEIDTADIDGDGDLDILSGSYDEHDLVLYKNDGSENFSKEIVHSHFMGVRTVKFHDIDGDDVLDIIAGSSTSDDIRWFKTENCTDVTNPSAHVHTDYDPEDDSSGIHRDSDLILEFNERVYEGSGNIVIKKSSDDSTVETIAVTDSKVTGSGSATITVNPSILLDASTGYYVEIAATAFDDSVNNSYAGITGSTTWNFTTMTACNGILRHNGANLDTSIDSQSLDVGDLDGDGDEDVVSIDYANSQLYWYENDGSESFTKTLLDISLSSPRTVELSDLDEDGDLDIIITSLGSNYIYWYENDGNASFSEYYIDSGLTDAYDIEVADLDGDGDKDVIATSYAGGNIYWFENDLDEDNDQYFKQKTIETDIAGVTYVKVVDMDGDDDLDVVATGYIADEINWYENDGSEGFTEHSIESTFSEALGLDVIDIDNDGDIDVVANSADDNGLVLFENDGSENFTLQTIDGDLSDAYEIDTADIDGDGDLDILSGSYDEHDLVLYKNDGSENFSKEIVHSHFMGVRTVKFHDIDGDDVLDIIAGSSTSDDIRWFKTENCTDVTNPSAHVHAAYDPEDGANYVQRHTDLVLEFNERVYEGSGNIVIKKSSDDSTVETIAVGDSEVTGSGSATITVNPSTLLDANTGYYVEIAATAFDDSVNNSYAGILDSDTWNFTTMTTCTGTLSYTAQADIDTLIDSKSVDTGDLDGDGDIDLVSVEYDASALYWYENNGNESFTKTLIDNSLSSPRTVEMADLDEDGDLDVIITSLGSNYIYWYQNDGNASFTEYYIDSGLTDAYDLEVADLDGDGDKDVIASSYAGGNIYWFENDLDEDNMQYFKQKTIESDITGVTYVKVIDMDGDDDLDVVATGYIADEVNWYENDGSENFTEHNIATSFNEAFGLEVVDIDNDGDIDVVAGSDSGAGLNLYLNDGSESFTVKVVDVNAQDVYQVELADMNGDGDIDILVPDYAAGDILLYQNDGNENFTKTTIESSMSGARAIEIADIDSDGVLDILVGSDGINTLRWYEATGCTADGPPFYIDFDPDDDSTGVSVSGDISITFNEIVDTQTGTIDIYENGNGLFEAIDVTTVSGNGSTTLTINPTNDFNGDELYYVRIDSGVINDTTGNTFAGLVFNGTWNFSTITVDGTDPQAITFSPVDNGTDVSVSTDLVVTFDEVVDIETGGTIHIYQGGTLFETFNLPDAQVTGTGSTQITIDPASNFADDTDYHVLISADAIDDTSGNSYAGISASTGWNFTTGDSTAPTIDHYSPPNTATMVERYQGLRIIFSETVVKGTGNVYIKRASDDVAVQTIDVTSSNVVVSGNEVKVGLTGLLNNGSEFYVEIDAGAFEDSSANDFAGITDNGTWGYFTNEDHSMHGG